MHLSPLRCSPVPSRQSTMSPSMIISTFSHENTRTHHTYSTLLLPHGATATGPHVSFAIYASISSNSSSNRALALRRPCSNNVWCDNRWYLFHDLNKKNAIHVRDAYEIDLYEPFQNVSSARHRGTSEPENTKQRSVALRTTIKLKANICGTFLVWWGREGKGRGGEGCM